MIQKKLEKIRHFSIYFLIKKGFNIYDISDLMNISFNTVRNYINKYEIKYPYTFYQTRKIFGRNKGFEMSLDQKELRSKIFSGEGNPFYGKQHEEKSKNKMSFNHHKWNGYEKLSGSYLCAIKNNAKQRNIEFNLTKEYLWDLFLQQNKKCAISGMNIKLYKKRKNKHKQTASVDRIDSNKGYIEGNVHWVHKDVNKMKWNFDLKYFIKTCIEVSKYNESKESNR